MAQLLEGVQHELYIEPVEENVNIKINPKTGQISFQFFRLFTSLREFWCSNSFKDRLILFWTRLQSSASTYKLNRIFFLPKMSHTVERTANKRSIVNVHTADTIYFWSIKHQSIVKLTRALFRDNRNGFSCELCIPRYRPLAHSSPCPFVGLNFDHYRKHVINAQNFYRRTLVWTSRKFCLS